MAAPGWRYEWPRDHVVHRDFKTEWWYFTGRLRAADGRTFGYELTFFRLGVRPPGAAPVQSRLVAEDLPFAHFAITDVKEGKFHFSQKVSRGAFGEAGFGDGVREPRLAWNSGWSLTMEKDGVFVLSAREEGRAIALRLESARPWVAHGQDGVSMKAANTAHASHYYSGTRLRARGTLTLDGAALPVEGESWFDHEWATNQLAPEQRGWDWFSVQFDDGAELMIYLLHRRDGTLDAASSGTWIAADGTTRHVTRDELRLTPLRWWTSGKTQARYPIGWRMEVPVLGLDAEVTTPVEAQELALAPVAYWEGLIDVRGTRGGQAVTGHGYLELAGYHGELVGLSSAPGK
jgi:predicted secreted hydrolase